MNKDQSLGSVMANRFVELQAKIARLEREKRALNSQNTILLAALSRIEASTEVGPEIEAIFRDETQRFEEWEREFGDVWGNKPHAGV